MTQMIVAPVARKVGEQVLDGVIDMFLRRNALVVVALWRLPILFRALFGDLRRCKHGMGRQHVEGVRRGGLFAALRISSLRIKKQGEVKNFCRSHPAGPRRIGLAQSSGKSTLPTKE